MSLAGSILFAVLGVVLGGGIGFGIGVAWVFSRFADENEY